LNPLAQDLRDTGGDFCGQISNLRFGQGILTNSFDPDLLSGSGVRPSDWSIGLSVQQQILPRASLEVAPSPQGGTIATLRFPSKGLTRG